MERLSQSEQRTLEQRMQKREVKAFTTAYIDLVDLCFSSCVDDFTSKALSSRENGCISRCVAKWAATQKRLSDRIQEHHVRELQK